LSRHSAVSYICEAILLHLLPATPPLWPIASRGSLIWADPSTIHSCWAIER
jgi:hypothetical protein